MCIVFFEWTNEHFVMVHNREELFSRATKGTTWWSTANKDIEILAPQDLQRGGMWFGYEHSMARVAFLTNVTSMPKDPSIKYNSSRGELVSNFLTSALSAPDFLKQLAASDREYAPYNLVLYSGSDLMYHSNRGSAAAGVQLPLGSYGLSDAATLRHPVLKVANGLLRFEALVQRPDPIEALLPFMHSSAIFLQPAEETRSGKLYGTRSTIRFVLENNRQGVLLETWLDPVNETWMENSFAFERGVRYL